MKIMGASRTVTIVLVSLIAITILVSMVNIGMSIFYERPDYSDYCDFSEREPSDKLDPEDFEECNNEFEEANNKFNQMRYFIFAGIGLVLILLGLFIPESITKITGLGGGGILVAQGIVFNLQNKVLTFITLAIVLVIIMFAGIRSLNKLR